MVIGYNFIIAKVSNLLKKIIDPMANMIRVADDRMFLIFMRICRISLFF